MLSSHFGILQIGYVNGLFPQQLQEEWLAFHGALTDDTFVSPWMKLPVRVVLGQLADSKSTMLRQGRLSIQSQRQVLIHQLSHGIQTATGWLIHISKRPSRASYEGMRP